MDTTPKLPVAISYVGSKYLLFDIDVVTWLRREHQLCGVMGGTLPQAPSQNVFLGLPVQIMPEEAQFLVEKGIGYIVDDARTHDQALQHADAARHAAYMSQIRVKGEQVTIAREEEKAEAKRQSLKKAKLKPKSKATQQKSKQEKTSPSVDSGDEVGTQNEASSAETTKIGDDEEVFLFGSEPVVKPTPLTSGLLPHGIVPTTSNLLLPTPPFTPSQSESMELLPNVPPSYALYKHLHSKSYFISPGLRFGCQYCVYPGDPLRFHSHFLAVGKEWDEEFDLLDIVGGGRLGTGVKKGFLIGAREPPSRSRSVTSKGATREEGKVRTFSIEWAAM